MAVVNMFEISGLIGLVILILNVWAIVVTINSSLSVERKVLWVVVILVLPLVGVILWLLLGPRAPR